jgi:hypothetical protein
LGSSFTVLLDHDAYFRIFPSEYIAKKKAPDKRREFFAKPSFFSLTLAEGEREEGLSRTLNKGLAPSG